MPDIDDTVNTLRNRPVKIMTTLKLKGGIEVGAVFQMNCGDNLMVTEIISANEVRVLFLNAVHEDIVEAVEIRRGSVKNPLFPSFSGHGFIGVGPYSISKSGIVSKTASIWIAMLQRVYLPMNENQKRQYAGTSVDAAWYNFQAFANWYKTRLNRFGLVDFRWDLDKDFLVPGNRVYGPDTCCLIPHPVNVLFTDSAVARGSLPLGVRKEGKRYRARVGEDSKSRNLGTFNTVREAQIAYWNAKFDAIRNTTIRYWNYLPEALAMRLIQFSWTDAFAYYGDDARLWSENEGSN